MTLLVQQLINGLVVGSVYALFALGFTLIFGVLHVLNLAHGAIFMWGSFVGLYCVSVLGLPFPVALLVAAVAAGVLSVVLDWCAFRPLRKRGGPEFSAIITSMGASLVLVNVAQRVSETRVWRYPFDTFPIAVYELANLRITLLQLVIIGCTVLVVAALGYLLFRTSIGRQIRAVAISERTASLLGANPELIHFMVFFVSGALAGIAGVLIGLAFNSVHFLMGEPYMLRAFVVIVLGGLGSVGGAVLAGLLLGVVQTLTVAYLSTGLSDAIVFSMLFLTLLVRPTGFFGQLRLERRVTRA
jgi:branched-chain amino acid transport system permease protein